jgi:hypothetical protein
MHHSARAHRFSRASAQDNRDPLRELTLGSTASHFSKCRLPMIGVRDLSIIIYFPLRSEPNPEVAVRPGDVSVCGFSRSLRYCELFGTAER